MLIMRIKRRLQQSTKRWEQYALCALVLCVAAFAGMNVLFFLRHRNTSTPTATVEPSSAQFRKSWIRPDSMPFNQGGVATNARNLVVVAGHSVLVSGHLEDAGRDEEDWFLLPYQKGRGLPQAIVAHVQAGLAAAAEDPTALLVFSGGETRAGTGPETEGASYYRIADALSLWPTLTTTRARTVTEEFATDSFENLMFSICRFREVTGRYPSKITVVSFTFKRKRFATMHTRALRWPDSRFQYVGVDPPAETGFDLALATRGEETNSVRPFETDPYGCHSQVLQRKRKDRNPFSRTAPYPLTCPEMNEILSFCGPELIDVRQVPWHDLH